MQAGCCALGCNVSFSSAAILPDGTYKWPTSKKMLLKYSGFSFLPNHYYVRRFFRILHNMVIMAAILAKFLVILKIHKAY